MNARDRRTPSRDGLDRRAESSRDARASLAGALDRCRDELAGRVARAADDPSPQARDYLREPIAEFTRVAARERIPPERALVMFKKMVGGIAMQGMHPENRSEVHRRLIEIAIESYYAQARSAQHLALLREAEPQAPTDAP